MVHAPKFAGNTEQWREINNIGSSISFCIIPASCRVIARSTVLPVSEDEKNDPLVKTKMMELNLAVMEKIRTP
jgi:hypothetical protein